MSAAGGGGGGGGCAAAADATGGGSAAAACATSATGATRAPGDPIIRQYILLPGDQKNPMLRSIKPLPKGSTETHTFFYPIGYIQEVDGMKGK